MGPGRREPEEPEAHGERNLKGQLAPGEKMSRVCLRWEQQVLRGQPALGELNLKLQWALG